MTKVSRNDLCPCGSGKKYKKCCDGKSGLLKRKVSLLSSGPSQEAKAQKLSAGLFGAKPTAEAAPEKSEG